MYSGIPICDYTHNMYRVEQWPPPDWTKVVVTWDEVLEHPHRDIKAILDWVDSYPGGNYHVSGYRSTEGFDFRFEQPTDATLFRITCL